MKRVEKTLEEIMNVMNRVEEEMLTESNMSTKLPLAVSLWKAKANQCSSVKCQKAVIQLLSSLICPIGQWKRKGEDNGHPDSSMSVRWPLVLLLEQPSKDDDDAQMTTACDKQKYVPT